jgi:presqualene diphosphate synthase
MAVVTLSYHEALTQVRGQVAASRSSFHAGMATLPKARREGMYALYGFCRAVDDIADDSPSPEMAARGLAEWRHKISDVFKGKASDAITTALLPAIKRFNLVEKEFQEIIDGMQMDSVTIVAPTTERLDQYCDLVASAVGRVSVRIFGDSRIDAMEVARHLGRALQLTNILRDLAEDAARGRLYLPLELIQKHQIPTTDPVSVLRHQNLPSVCEDVAAIARDHYVLADLFMKKCNKSAMRPARIMRSYYGAIFDQLVASKWRDPMKRVTLPKWKKIALVLKGFWG